MLAFIEKIPNIAVAKICLTFISFLKIQSQQLKEEGGKKRRNTAYLPHRHSADTSIQNPCCGIGTDFTHENEFFLPADTVCLHHLPACKKEVINYSVYALCVMVLNKTASEQILLLLFVKRTLKSVPKHEVPILHTSPCVGKLLVVVQYRENKHHRSRSS